MLQGCPASARGEESTMFWRLHSGMTCLPGCMHPFFAHHLVCQDACHSVVFRFTQVMALFAQHGPCGNVDDNGHFKRYMLQQAAAAVPDILEDRIHVAASSCSSSPAAEPLPRRGGGPPHPEGGPSAAPQRRCVGGQGRQLRVEHPHLPGHVLPPRRGCCHPGCPPPPAYPHRDAVSVETVSFANAAQISVCPCQCASHHLAENRFPS